MPANRSKPVYAKYIEHIPPDVTACIFWLKNRDPQHWRDSQQLERALLTRRVLTEHKADLIGPCNHGGLQWSTMSYWTYR